MAREHSEETSVFPGYITLRDSEHSLILRTLEAVGWVIGGATGAAARLGVKRTTLINKMKKLGISRPLRGFSMPANVVEIQSSAVEESV